MILLDVENRIILDLLKDRVGTDRRDTLDVTCADFDGCYFHASTVGDNKSLIDVSLSVKCWAQLEACGVNKMLEEHYPGLVQRQAESGFEVTIRVDLDKSAADKELPMKVALLKRNVLSAPFFHCFNLLDSKAKTNEVIEVRYRDDEAFYLKPEGDRLIVIFSITFRDADDVIFSKVFLQEFVDVRKSIRNAPAVSYSQKGRKQEPDPPLELQSLGNNVVMRENSGFVSVVLFSDQLAPKNRNRTVNMMLMMRDYLHYHIKCSKAYLHNRMRNRVDAMLQILNRAKQPAADKSSKTISGKTFTRKV